MSHAPTRSPPPAPRTPHEVSPASLDPITPAIAVLSKEYSEEHKASTADLEKRLQSKTADLTGQNSTRNQAVLRSLYQRSQKGKETQHNMALSAARCFNREKWFSEKLVSWEISWRRSRSIPEGKKLPNARGRLEHTLLLHLFSLNSPYLQLQAGPKLKARNHTEGFPLGNTPCTKCELQYQMNESGSKLH